MPYTVTEDCIACKYMDCIEICPVDCFFEGLNMVVIHPDECIDCAACVPTCPVEAIIDDRDERSGPWIDLNRQYASVWPRITHKGQVPPDADDWCGVPNKFERMFDPNPPGSASPP